MAYITIYNPNYGVYNINANQPKNGKSETIIEARRFIFEIFCGWNTHEREYFDRCIKEYLKSKIYRNIVLRIGRL